MSKRDFRTLLKCNFRSFGRKRTIAHLYRYISTLISLLLANGEWLLKPA